MTDICAALGHDKAQTIIDQITSAYESRGGPPPQGGFGFGPQPSQPPFGGPPMGFGQPPQPPLGFGQPPPSFGGRKIFSLFIILKNSC